MSGSNFDGGFNKLIPEDDLPDEEPPPCTSSNQSKRQLSVPKLTAERLPAVSLAALAAVLLIVDISLGAHYNKLTDSHLSTEDVERINDEMVKIQESYKAALDSMEEAKKQMDSELSRQKEISWELEHQSKRGTEYKAQIEKLTQDIASMRTHLPLIKGGCKHCPAGWILMDSVCYYFSFLDNVGLKTWQKAQDFCKTYGGNLAVIDSKEKENTIVRHLINNQVSNKIIGFWIGLKDLEEEGSWTWINGKHLVEGYWADGEPNDMGNEDCAVVYGVENYFKAWNDARCSSTMKWICEKAQIP